MRFIDLRPSSGSDYSLVVVKSYLNDGRFVNVKSKNLTFEKLTRTLHGSVTISRISETLFILEFFDLTGNYECTVYSTEEAKPTV